MRDIRLWIEENLKDFTPYDYQLASLLNQDLLEKYMCWGRRTGKTTTAVIQALHFASTWDCAQRGCNVLVLTPNRSHLEVFFGRMRKLMEDSPLKDRVVRNVKGFPPVMGFDNGAQIIGFSTYNDSNSRSLAARGQNADLVIIDEAAYTSEQAFDDIIRPILLTHPTFQVAAYSTPKLVRSGEKNWFEESCKRCGYHHVTSCSRPDWSAVVEMVRKDFGDKEQAWRKEVLAELDYDPLDNTRFDR